MDTPYPFKIWPNLGALLPCPPPPVIISKHSQRTNCTKFDHFIIYRTCQYDVQVEGYRYYNLGLLNTSDLGDSDKQF